MAKIVGISKKRAQLLNRLVRYLEVEHALEMGTSLGIGTAAMAAGNEVQITTLEGCPATAAVAEKQFQKFDLQNINLRVGEFGNFLVDRGQWTGNGKNSSSQPTADNREQERNSKSQITTSNPRAMERPKPTTENSQPITENREPRTGNRQQVGYSKSQVVTSNPRAIERPQPTTENSQPITENREPGNGNRFDLIYFDGNHRKQPTLDYFQKLLPTAHNDTVFIFDDIHWSREMEEAWEEIRKHPAVKVTIDTFFWGLVFFRKEQEKEHFVIRV